MNRWLLRLVGRATLTHRTVRWRLAALYSALFLASGAALLTISYVLVDHATAGTFTYHDDNGFVAAARTGTPETSAPPEVSVQSSDGAVQALTP